MRTMLTLFIGTYTRDTAAEGIYRCDWDPVSGRFAGLRLAVAADNPSFLIAHGASLFAVHETADFSGARQGAVAQYHAAGERLEQVALLGSGGAHPCHLAATGDRLAVANYSGANVALFAFAGGLLAERANIVEFAGRGPHRRQAGPHPHGVYFIGDELLVPDLGLDRIHRLDAATGSIRGAWTVAPGSGPRQLAIGGNGYLYLLNELANRIDVLRDGSILQSRTTLPGGAAEPGHPGHEAVAASTAGAIALTSDGRQVIVSNRGHDSLGCFPVDPGTGLLGPPVFIACDPHPRHFLVIEDRVIVASRDAGTLTAFELWPGGSLGPAVAQIACPAPVCVLAWPSDPAIAA
jgi:6-phosphogluconolactonase